jgi:hypothetical protein
MKNRNEMKAWKRFSRASEQSLLLSAAAPFLKKKRRRRKRKTIDVGVFLRLT